MGIEIVGREPQHGGYRHAENQRRDKRRPSAPLIAMEAALHFPAGVVAEASCLAI